MGETAEGARVALAAAVSALRSDGGDPDSLGAVLESLRAAPDRRARGLWVTPPAVADAVVGWAFDVVDGGVARVCDPAAGAGAFLLAAARRLRRDGWSVPEVLAALHGCDTDPLAVAACIAALELWAAGEGVDGASGLGDRVVVGDGLAREGESGFDVVVGNPPFLGQLKGTTARSRESAATLRERFGDAAAGYADTAALFLVAGCRLTRAGGAVAMIVPQSFLAARDGAGARRAVAAAGSVEALWSASSGVFEASVRVCVPVVRVGAAQSALVARFEGPSQRAVGEVAAGDLGGRATWSHLLADAVPMASLRASGTIGDGCTVTADFRDQYYGLTGHVVERDGVPVVTSGLVDPAVCRWGSRPARLHKQRWEAPAVDVAGLGGAMASWAAARLVPKVLVATQTRVIEAVVDEAGAWLPSTPVITVVPPEARLWHVAAALLAPPVTAWALHHHGGAALAAGALRLRAKEVAALPAPVDAAAWDAGAALVRAAQDAATESTRRELLLELGAVMCAAYDVHPDPVLEWWASRLPTLRP